MKEFSTIRYERPGTGVARIVLDRPGARNAQNLEMTYEIDAALQRALHDDQVGAIVLAATDPHFSAGHDLFDVAVVGSSPQTPRGVASGFREPGVHGAFAREQESYLQMVRRWRDLAKPTIAAVQGHCVAGGLMLAWACDLIYASDDAMFIDPTVAMGVCGVEWFAHPYELGPRKAKELLFTAAQWNAQEAWRLGMVNRVIPRAELAEEVLAIAAGIAAKPRFAVQMVKAAVNRAVDLAGQPAAIDAAFALHHLCHADNRLVHGAPMLPKSARL